MVGCELVPLLTEKRNSMKKYFLIIAAIVGLAACKKEDKVSQEVVVSTPTITVTGDQFYSIHVNDPVPTITATAYDSVLGQSYTPTVDMTVVDNTTPGLYVINITVKNRNGYQGQSVAYVAVTDIDDAIDLSGTYERVGTGAEVHVTKILRGLYETDDVGGAPTLPITAYFAQLNDTTIDLPPQPTEAGTLSAENASVSMMPGDTTFTYIVVNGSFGTAQRTFQKQ